MKFLLIIPIALIIWTVWGYYVSNVEQAKYSVIQTTPEYEVRVYPEHVVAQTTIIDSDYKNAISIGFRRIAGYIFGNNTQKKSIAMAAPVTAKNVAAREIQNENKKTIAMTAPVVTAKQQNGYTVTFGMPSAETMETLPIPNDSSVVLKVIPEKTFAVRRFGGYRSENNIKSEGDKLKDALQNADVAMIADIQYAGYNGPFTPPWMTRNEIMSEILISR